MPRKLVATNMFDVSVTKNGYAKLYRHIFNELKFLSTKLRENKIKNLKEASKDTKLVANNESYTKYLYQRSKQGFLQLHKLDTLFSYSAIEFIQYPVFGALVEVSETELSPEYLIDNNDCAKYFISVKGNTAYGYSTEVPVLLKPISIDLSSLFTNNFEIYRDFLSGFKERELMQRSISLPFGIKHVYFDKSSNILKDTIQRRLPKPISAPNSRTVGSKEYSLDISKSFKQIPVNHYSFLNNSIFLFKKPITLYDESNGNNIGRDVASTNETKGISSNPKSYLTIDATSIDDEIYSGYPEELTDRYIYEDININTNFDDQRNKICLKNLNYLDLLLIKNDLPIIAACNNFDYPFSLDINEVHKSNFSFVTDCLSYIINECSLFGIKSGLIENDPLFTAIVKLRNYLDVADYCYELSSSKSKNNILTKKMLSKMNSLLQNSLSDKSFGFNSLYNNFVTTITKAENRKNYYYCDMNYSSAVVILTGFETNKDIEILTEYAIKKLMNYPEFKIPVTTGMVITKIIDKFLNRLNFDEQTANKFVNTDDVNLSYQVYYYIKRICKELIDEFDSECNQIDGLNQKYCSMANKFYKSMIEIAKLLDHINKTAESRKKLLLKLIDSFERSNLFESGLDFSFYAYDIKMEYNQKFMNILNEYHRNYSEGKCKIITNLANLADDLDTAMQLVVFEFGNKLPYLMHVKKLI